MNEDPANLDRLHDLAMPPEVAWWPLAPGWYVVIAVALIFLFILSHLTWKTWRANAYRRVALRELTTAENVPAIAELLRRTALATTPREAVAEMTGVTWIDWLAKQSTTFMPDAVRDQLTSGIYHQPSNRLSVDELREYASHWITNHQVSEQTC
jgi:hypothetical protein